MKNKYKILFLGKSNEFLSKYENDYSIYYKNEYKVNGRYADGLP